MHSEHPLSSITIRSFQPSDQKAVKTLVLAGLLDHWGKLDLSKNPDLDDIAASYQSGLFLVACRNQEIIATGALLPRSRDTAEIVRMSVAAGSRRQGIGNLMLTNLCAQARLRGFRRIILETTSSWRDVINFYLRYGFSITHEKDGDVWFELRFD